MHSRREGNDINCTHFSKRENDIESRTTLCYRAKLECMSISHAVIKFALKREKQKLMSVMPHAESVTEYFFLSTMRIIANQNMISSVLAARRPFFF